MQDHDVIVVGGGISGLAFAWHAAAQGREVLVLERDDRLGGCMHSQRLDDGYWFEMGAHTAYNSYGGMLDIIEGAGLMASLLPRVKAPFRMLRDGEIQSIGKQLGWLELLSSAWRIMTLKKDGLTVRDYYGALLGKRNYQRFMSAFLAAVPCQSADDFPADLLFKKRPRRKDVMRSYTLKGGLQSVVEGAATREGITVRKESAVQAVSRQGAGFAVQLANGETLKAADVAVALPPRAAAQVLAADFAPLADALGSIAMAELHSTGVVIPAAATSLERVAGIVPAQDDFHSAVSRDMVPDDHRRAFAFHFRPGVDEARRLERIQAVLGVDRADIEAVFEQPRVLPAPAPRHHQTVARIEALLPETGLHLTGNYFAGMALEDCVGRSLQETQRLAGHSASA
jgi:protoporphyrinogen/coproporphyrinogen III oxidase